MTLPHSKTAVCPCSDVILSYIRSKINSKRSPPMVPELLKSLPPTCLHFRGGPFPLPEKIFVSSLCTIILLCERLTPDEQLCLCFSWRSLSFPFLSYLLGIRPPYPAMGPFQPIMKFWHYSYYLKQRRKSLVCFLQVSLCGDIVNAIYSLSKYSKSR